MTGKKEYILDMDNPREKQMALDLLRGLTGIHRLEICKHRPRRSDRQNRYYWPCFVKPFGDYLREHGNKHFNDEMAHEVLKRMFLEASAINDETGEAYTYVRSTTDLNTSEFNEYLDKCASFLAIDCGFIVADPSDYHEGEAA